MVQMMKSSVFRIQLGASRRKGGALRLRPSATGAPGTSLTALSQKGLIFGRGEDGAWDEASVGYPVVR